MSTRDVIDAEFITWTREAGSKPPTDRILAALAAAGYVVVPRKLTEEMVVSILHDTGVERARAVWFWRSALAAAEAEAKETGNGS